MKFLCEISVAYNYGSPLTTPAGAESPRTPFELFRFRVSQGQFGNRNKGVRGKKRATRKRFNARLASVSTRDSQAFQRPREKVFCINHKSSRPLIIPQFSGPRNPQNRSWRGLAKIGRNSGMIAARKAFFADGHYPAIYRCRKGTVCRLPGTNSNELRARRVGDEG